MMVVWRHEAPKHRSALIDFLSLDKWTGFLVPRFLCVRLCIYLSVIMWRSEVTLRCGSSGAICLVFLRCGLSLEHGACLTGQQTPGIHLSGPPHSAGMTSVRCEA